MTFAKLLIQLSHFDPKLPLVFKLDGAEIGAGYHVTELRHSVSTGIDCGGSIETWDEAKLQLFDVPGKTHMSIVKFSNIVQQSLIELPILADATLLVEYATGNIGLKSLTLKDARLDEGRALIELQNMTAACKPAQRKQLQNDVIDTKDTPGATKPALLVCCG